MNVTPIERFRTLIGPVPWIAPIGIDCYFPAVIEATKTHEEDFYFTSSMDVFTVSDEKRVEQLRSKVESSISLGGKWHLVVGRVRFHENRGYQLRHGYVWDGVRWYEDSSHLGGYKPIRAVPSWVYLGGLALVFILLRIVWSYSMRLKWALIPQHL